MTFEDALSHASSRRPVLPHVQLRSAIYRTYPRPWAPHLAARTSSASTVFSEDVEPEPEVEEPPAEPEVASAPASASRSQVSVQQSRSQMAGEKPAETESARALASPKPAEPVATAPVPAGPAAAEPAGGIAEDVPPPAENVADSQPTEVAPGETAPPPAPSEPRDEQPEVVDPATA